MEIVCVAFPSWNTEYVKSTIELMKELACKHNVLYVDYAFTWKDVLWNARTNPLIPSKKILGFENRLQKVTLENGAFLHVLSLPPILPANWAQSAQVFDSINALNTQWIVPFIRRAMHTLGMKQPMLINAFNPFLGIHMHKKLGEIATFYYCYDNLGAAKWAGKQGNRVEEAFIQQVDAVVFTSDNLQAEKGQKAKASYVVKNGVDIRIYQHPQLHPSSTTPKKIVYVGSIDNRIDAPMIFQLANTHTEWQFHFIGKSSWEHHPQNIHFHGALSPEKVSEHLRTADAGIIPFVKNDFTRNIYPMKINEYLAMGLPVVLTDFASLTDFEGMVYVANSTQAFEKQLIMALSEDTTEKRAARITLANRNSWTARALALENILQQYEH